MRRLLAATACLALVGCGGETGSGDPSPTTRTSTTASGSPTASQSGTFTVRGFVTANGSFGLACKGTGASADLHGGAPVVVLAEDGTRLASGALGGGFADDDAPQRRCIFDFTVRRVPEGKGPFQVQVADRPPVSFERRQAGQVEVRLGGD